jgi:aerobic carbon-monoxide dehydrogenase small subunit
MAKTTLSVNGLLMELEVEPHESLNHVLRERLGLTGTKMGCDTGGCGSCTVLVDGKAVYSCMTYALQAEGKQVLTIEGLQDEAGLAPIQRAFVDKGGLQCGFCTPGFVMSAYALLLASGEPSDAQIRDALVGNICRCTGYVKIIDSVKAAASSKKPRAARRRA